MTANTQTKTSTATNIQNRTGEKLYNKKKNNKIKSNRKTQGA